MKNLFKREQFRRYGWLAVSAVFVLILVGGIVRSTGAGMGCPDWPKCFGQYIPPTHEAQLPPSYKEDFSKKRVEKAQRFAKMLIALGFTKQAAAILDSPDLHEPEEFNAVKTWTEYFNRLWGALTGLFALLALITGVKYFKTQKAVAWLTVAGVFLIFFNGWMGSILVSTNLTSWVITVHYVLAYIAAFLLMIAAYKVNPVVELTLSRKTGLWFGVGLLLSVIQVISGTALRDTTDLLVKTNTLMINGELNMSGLGEHFNRHRILAFVSGIVNLALLVYLFRNKNIDRKLLKAQFGVIVLIGIQVLSGSLNLLHNFPVVAQVQHIFGAGIIFGIQAYIFISYLFSRN